MRLTAKAQALDCTSCNIGDFPRSGARAGTYGVARDWNAVALVYLATGTP